MSDPIISLYPYLKFTKCCDQSVIYFRGTRSITSGDVYVYEGITPFVGSGGQLEPGFCYVIESLISQTPTSSYPGAPPIAQIGPVTNGCDDERCEPCEIITCECPEGYVEIDGECVETIIIEATYTGTTVQLNAAANQISFNKFGLRLYPDITASVKPLLGSGNPYLVKANNGAGATITPLISGVQSTLWGCELPSACSTFTPPASSYGGRLNITGLWNNAYNVTTGDGPELSFEYCIDIAETKQYLVGIAGDNKVKLYVDGILNVFLNVGGVSGTAPFNWWHVFPITLTAGTHVIRLGGINVNNTPGAFAGEIYDIDLATFQSTLTFPAIGAGNCGNTVANLEPYIIFSTEDMIGLNVPDPNDPGIWECPEGYTLNECLGIPVCTIVTSYVLECFCYLLIPCDGVTPPFLSITTNLENYINEFVSVSYGEFNGCVYVVLQNDPLICEEVVLEVIIDGGIICDCPCTCYTIIGEIKSVDWIDCFGVYNSVETPLSPFQICATTYPITFPFNSTPLQIINSDLCIESTIFNDVTCDEETVFNCEPACYLLEDCLDNTNVIYSNSTSLLGPANLGQIVTIAGYTECWKILIPESCDCPINVTVTQVHNCCEACLPNINYKLTSCKDSTAFTYTSDDLSLYVDRVIRREDCPEECWIVSEIDGNIPTDTPIVILEDYLDCEKCYRKYYLLEDCLGLQNDIITYTDLSLYVDKVITLDWCPETCWEVSETLEDEGAGIISDILNTYNLCIDCLTNAPCICSTIKNYNTISQIYKYLDCYGLLQSVTLLPNQKSNRLCLIRWYAPEPCDELIVTITSSTGVVSNITVYQNSVTHPGPVFVNDKPTWNDAGNTLYIYYDGTKWILSKNLNPLIVPAVYTTIGFINCNGDCDCPTGTWQQSSSIPNQDIYVTTELKYTIEYFGNCINGVCPPVKNKQKSVTPGYNTPGCEAWKYEEISCRAAEAMYKQVLELRYGISNCCPEEDEQYIVQKELIDLAALYDPAYPCATNSCGCNNDCNCSTAEPVCPPIPLTYNCFCTQSACECIEIGNGSGEYSTLALCQAACVPLPITSYNCTNGTCVLVSGPGGQYPTLSACEEDCEPLPIISYNCLSGICFDPGDGTGIYPTLTACQTVCTDPPQPSWNCVDGTCINPGNGSGQYLSLSACQTACIPIPVTYNCVDGSCVNPGDGTGMYGTLAQCQQFCEDVYESYDCLNGVCTDPGDGSGVYPTLAACDAACAFPPPNISFNCLNGNCTDPADGSGVYPTLLDCTNVCADPPQVSYNCFLGQCTDPGNGSGVYPTLLACQTACVPVPAVSYNCVSGNCVDPGTGLGLYPTLNACQVVCNRFPPITPCVTTCASSLIQAPLPGTTLVFSAYTITSTSNFIPTTFYPPNSIVLCNSSYTYSGSLWASWNAPSFTYTLNFSSPINNVFIFLNAYSALGAPNPNPPGAESFVFTTNAGFVDITCADYCCATITGGNTVTAMSSPGINCLADVYCIPGTCNGSGAFIISSSLPYTSLTITGITNTSGINIGLCEAQFGESNTSTIYTTFDALPIPAVSYNCVDCNCVSVAGPSGSYQTLLACQASGCENNKFITTWETTTAGESITLPYYLGGTYAGTIDWGDSTTSANSFATSTHIYATPGIYTVTICGTTNGWNFTTTPVSKTKIKSVVTWGQLTLGNDIGGYFNFCTNLDLSSVTDALDLFGTGITDMYAMFGKCYSLTTINNINFWDTSAVTNMALMFTNCILFNQPLSFNTSAVTNMSFMFSNCSAFNQSLSFNTSLVTTMQGMFGNATSFNQPLSFNTIEVTDMSGMFGNATAFNQLLTFNTIAVTNMSNMFFNATSFNQALTFNTSLVTDMSSMFSGATSFNQPLSFNTIAVTTMQNMFAAATSFNSLLTFNTIAVTTMQNMFFYATSFNQALTFNTSAVTDMIGMFGQCTVFNQPLTFNTSLVTNMSIMFANSPAFQQDISSWNIQNVTDFTNFMLGKTPATWSQLNFDNLLCGWSLQTVQSGLTIDFGTANYTNAIGGPCYTILDIAPNNWTINSGGGV